MTRDDLQVDRRTLLRATSFLASVPADVGTVWATAGGGEGASEGSADGAVPSLDPGPVGYAYGGAPIPASADAETDDDPQGYGEHGYGGAAQ